MTGNSTRFLRFGGLGLLLLGTVVVLVMSAAWVDSRDVQTWPTVDARVIRSDIEVSKKLVPLGRNQKTYVDFFALRIEYEYQVDGQRFTGSRMNLAANPCGYDRREMEQWTDKHPLGALIPVHYSPTSPERSVVEITGGPTAMGVPFGILMIAGGVVMRRLGKPRPEGQTATRPTTSQPPSTPPEPRPEVRHQLRFSEAGRRRRSKRTHWLIRTVGVLLGLAFLLLGAVTLPVGLAQCIQEGGAGNAAQPARLAVTVLMGLFTVFGAVLTWMGMKRQSEGR
jgi:hypothetical protein